MASDYCTVAEVKAVAGITDSGDDTRLAIEVTAASRMIDALCGRSFWQDADVVTREFYAADGQSLDLLDQGGIAREISSTTGLIVKIDEADDGTYGTTLTSGTDFLLLPHNAVADGMGYSEVYLADNYSFPRSRSGRAGVQITAKFGWPAVPGEIKEAAILQSLFLYKSGDAPLGVADFGGGGQMMSRDRWHTAARALALAFQIVPVG